MLNKRMFFWAAATFAAAFAAVFAQPADTAAAAEPGSAAAAAAILKITTDPPGAAVTINGREYGLSPVEITGLETGPHTVELGKAGHFRRKATIQLDSAGAELHFELSRPAALTVTSEPAGAQIYMDGNDIGTAPVQRDKMRPGEYKVSAAMDGYKKIDTTVNAASGGNDTLHIVLEPKPVEQPQPEQAPAARTDKKAQGKSSWKTETILVAFFVFIAVLIGVEKASYK